MLGCLYKRYSPKWFEGLFAKQLSRYQPKEFPSTTKAKNLKLSVSSETFLLCRLFRGVDKENFPVCAVLIVSTHYSPNFPPFGESFSFVIMHILTGDSHGVVQVLN